LGLGIGQRGWGAGILLDALMDILKMIMFFLNRPQFGKIRAVLQNFKDGACTVLLN